MRESKSRALPLGYTPSGWFQSKRPERTLRPFRLEIYGVGDGTRTRDTRNHNPMLYQLNYTHHRLAETVQMARLKGLEPLAHCLEGSCSIHLSYRRVWSG